MGVGINNYMTIIELTYNDQTWRLVVRSHFTLPSVGDNVDFVLPIAGNVTPTAMKVAGISFKLENDGQGFYNEIVAIECKARKTPSQD